MLAVFSLSFIGCSEDMDYKKACEEKDFPKAYNIVDNLKQIEVDKHSEFMAEPSHKWWNGNYNKDRDKKEVEYEAAKKKASEAERYVILQEAMMLLEQGDNSSLMRIVGIVKEHDAEWLFDDLIEIANRIDDTELSERLLKMKRKRKNSYTNAEAVPVDEIER